MLALRSLGFSATGKEISFPLDRRMKNSPSLRRAEIAVSTKVFIPFRYYNLSLLPGKLFCPSQFLDLQAYRFTEFHIALHIKNRFASTLCDMNMHRIMIVAVEEKSVPFLGEYCRHSGGAFLMRT